MTTPNNLIPKWYAWLLWIVGIMTGILIGNAIQIRWQNVYVAAVVVSRYYLSKEEADADCDFQIPRTHYLKTYWNSEGVIVPELSKWIKIENI